MTPQVVEPSASAATHTECAEGYPSLTSEVRRTTAGFTAAFLVSFTALLLPLALFTLRLWTAGEIAPNWTYVAQHDVRYGRLIDDYKDFKLYMTQRRQPQVLVLGSSRVMGIGSDNFALCGHDRSCFYNAGGLMPNIGIGFEALTRLPTGYFPRVLILGLDYWHIAENPAVNDSAGFTPRRNVIAEIHFDFATLKTVAEEASKSPSLRHVILHPEDDPPDTLGLAARAGRGFRPDGSYDYGPGLPATLKNPARTTEMRELAKAGVGWFYEAQRVDPNSMKTLRSILALATDHGAKVIGYTPPFTRDIVDVLDTPGRFPAWHQLPVALSNTFGDYGFPFVFFDTQTSAGCDPNASTDGMHPALNCNHQLVLRLLDNPQVAEILRPYVDEGSLRELAAKNPVS